MRGSEVTKLIQIIDSDLIEKVNEQFPNTASMRLSGYWKDQGEKTKLVTKWEDINPDFPTYVSKVFTETQVPEWVMQLPNVIYGGTGFYYPNPAPKLPNEIHHCFPDYHLYDEWVNQELKKGRKKRDLRYFTDASIGKMTEHCFMHCSYCVNRDSNEVVFNAHIDEFYDKRRKFIILLDDQFFGYAGWESLFDELDATGKEFQFKQGLDIRLLSDAKAERLANCNYHEDFIFAFDNINDTEIVKRKLYLWRRYTDKRTKLYVFCGYRENRQYDEEFWIKDICNLFKRIFILAEYDCTAYVMRHLDHKKCPWKTIYTEAASFTAQQWALRTMSYRQYCIGRGMGDLYKQYKHDPERYLKDGHKKYSQWIAMEEFEKKYPEIAAKYFDLNYKDFQLRVTA
jgi:hypothetical protein